MTVTRKDRCYEALLKRVYGFGHPRVAMGILAKDGAREHKAEGYNDPLTVLDIATWMEFGVTLEDGTEIPARSFIRAWYDEASPKLREEFATLMKAVIAGKRTKAEILELIGLRGQGAIQARIAAGIEPPNKPSTVERKGSSTPLIASGQLRSSISYAVLDAGGEGDE